MKTSVLSLLCAFIFACSSPPVPVPTPVDMKYNVNVEMLEDTCADSAIQTDLPPTLKVIPQPDGTMTVKYPTGLIPGSGNYTGLVITDENTSGQLTAVVAKDTDKPVPALSLSLTGSLNMDSADLVLEGQRVLFQNDKYVPCDGNTKVRLSGPARPLWDKLAPDGKYNGAYKFYSLVCPPSDPEVNDPVSWVVPLDIQDRNGSARLSFDSHNEMVLFEMPTATLTSKEFVWNGTLYIVEQESNDGIIFTSSTYPFETNVAGKLLDDGSYYLRMTINNPDWEPCRFVLDATNTKHPPDTVSVNNVYRLAFVESNECIPDVNGNPSVSNFVMEGDLALREDGSYLSVMHGHQRFDLPLDPNTIGLYSGKWGTSTLTLDYTAFVAPSEV